MIHEINYLFNLFFYFKIAVLFNRLFFNHFTLICYSYFFLIDIHTLLRNLIHYPKLIRLHNSLKCHILPLPRLFHIKWLNRSTLRLIHSIRPYYHAHLFLRNIPLLNCWVISLLLILYLHFYSMYQKVYPKLLCKTHNYIYKICDDTYEIYCFQIVLKAYLTRCLNAQLHPITS